MAKVFRLYTGGTDTYQDWNEGTVFPYDSKHRETIEDPEGATAHNEITSIPSPFARIDLVKVAFSEVCRMKKLEGNTIFHKMVSDSLDVGEIFFNIDKFKDKVEIIAWDYKQCIEELKSSGIEGHRFYGDALEKYMKSDASTYNFNQLKNIYLLNYKNGPSPLNIIGATSPASIFFSTANCLDYVNDIFFAQDKPFDDDYLPLYKREDKEYIKMWFILKNSIPGFSSLFREVNNYLELTYQKIEDNKLKQDLKTINASASGFGQILARTTNITNSVEVLGHDLYKKETVRIASGFEVVSSKVTTDQPLVLPIEAGNRYANVPYTTGKWGNTNQAPYYDVEANINNRHLPFDGSQRAYLTISDFLEDYIVKVNHTLNKEYFFDGNCKLDNDYRLSYLLPLKKRFFDYFSTEELKLGLPGGEKMIEMESVGIDSIKVILRIPIVGDGRNVNHIEYSRIYYGGSNNADIDTNRGGIIDMNFSGFIMPMVKFNNPEDAIYTVGCISNYNKKISMTFFNEEQTVQPVSKGCRNTNGEVTSKIETYTIEKKNFDFIQISGGQQSCGIMIPTFKPQISTDTYSFAIDLGTSNTHIEYLKNHETTPKTLSFSSEQPLLCRMFVQSINKALNVVDDLIYEEMMIEKDFIPKEVGGKSDFKFPTRTVLSYAKTIDWQNVIYPFELVNLPLTHDKRRPIDYNAVEDNIKWGTGNQRRMIESYINCLMLMLRNKVILSGGDINRTNITWFYPISMAPKRLNIIKSTWNDAYNKYFGAGSTRWLTESEAPIFYYFRRYAAATNLVNVDIGGGTTDIAFAKDQDIQCVTSFKFASNALFENSFSDVDPHNGIIDFYKPAFKSIFEEKKKGELQLIYASNDEKPANMAMFLFSLKNNSLVNELNKNEIDLTAKLREDEDFKIIFIIFYTAIIYHIAQIIKVKGLEVPRHISFSGNGSKVLSILTNDSKHLAGFTKKIIELVMGRSYSGELDILGLDSETNPKEATCKGGLMAVQVQDIGKEKRVALNAGAQSMMSDADTYEAIDGTYKQKESDAVNVFFNFFFDKLAKAYNLDDNFGVSAKSLQIAKEECRKDILTYIEKGLSLMKKESDIQNRLDETLFFYPIKGILQALSIEIENKTKKN